MHHDILIYPKKIFDAQALGASGGSTCSAESAIQDFSQSSGYYIIQCNTAGPGSITLTALHSLDNVNWAEVSGVGSMAADVTSGVVLKKGDFGIAHKVKVKARNTSASAITSLTCYIANK